MDSENSFLGLYAAELDAAISEQTRRIIAALLNVYAVPSAALLTAADELEQLDDVHSLQAREFATLVAIGLREKAANPEKDLDPIPDSLKW